MLVYLLLTFFNHQSANNTRPTTSTKDISNHLN